MSDGIKIRTSKLNALEHFYMPFERVDDEKREVEGVCYANASVVGDKWNLTRGAMERALPRYMEMPCVRAMHQSIAAGKGEQAWIDDDGKIHLRSVIVDDNEWKKVKAGVYRGYSIGGKPIIARGHNIEEFDWIETSLVDRPKDPDAVFDIVRVEETPAEYEIAVLPALASSKTLQMTRAQMAHTQTPAELKRGLLLQKSLLVGQAKAAGGDRAREVLATRIAACDIELKPYLTL